MSGLVAKPEDRFSLYTAHLLSSVAGVPAEKLVEAHGTFATATCTICRHKVEGAEIKVKYYVGNVFHRLT